MSKIYILEYNQSWTGGSIIAIAENIDELKEIVTTHLKNEKNDIILITDEYKVQLYKLSKHRNISGYPVQEIIKLLNDKRLIKENILSQCIRENGYANNYYRIDWILQHFDFEGLILTETYNLKYTLKAHIVSDTYYSG